MRRPLLGTMHDTFIRPSIQQIRQARKAPQRLNARAREYADAMIQVGQEEGVPTFDLWKACQVCVCWAVFLGLLGLTDRPSFPLTQTGGQAGRGGHVPDRRAAFERGVSKSRALTCIGAQQPHPFTRSPLNQTKKHNSGNQVAYNGIVQMIATHYPTLMPGQKDMPKQVPDPW